jgi:hypothetical protein
MSHNHEVLYVITKIHKNDEKSPNKRIKTRVSLPQKMREIPGSPQDQSADQ